MAVAVVTDSTADLPAELGVAAGIEIVPLHVSSDRQTTSRPAPGAFFDLYERLLAGGATGVVSVHISAQLSGTFEAAALAARRFDGAVVAVDSGTAGIGVGFAALAAAASASDGDSLTEVASAADLCASRTTTLFCVDSLDRLRRGGRIGAARALLGTALAVKPILRIAEGQVAVADRVRTTARARRRLLELATASISRVSGIPGAGVDVGVQHLGAAGAANELAAILGLLPQVNRVLLAEIGPVVAAHVGTGVVAAVIAPAVSK